MAKRYALLIGVEQLAHLGDRSFGACNDVALMAYVLAQRDCTAFRLTDDEATLAHIRERWLEIARHVEPGDTVVVFFSGFSKRLEGESGADGCLLVPHDFVPEAARETGLAQGQLARWIEALPACDVVVILDTRHTEPIAAMEGKTVVWLRAADRSDVGWFPSDVGRYHSAFTYSLSRALMVAAPDATYEQVFEHAVAGVVLRFPRQRPAISGAANAPVFGASAAVPVILARTDHAVTINVGDAAGVTPGSVWTVHAPDMVGEVEITDVRIVDAGARVRSESSESAVLRGARIVEKEHDFGDMRLRVAIGAVDPQEPRVVALREELQRTDLLELVDTERRTDVTVRWKPGTASSEHGTFRIVSEGNVPHLPHGHCREAMDPIAVRLDLENLARYRNTLALANPDRGTRLAGKVELILYRRDGAGWVEIVPDRSSGLCRLLDSDRIDLEIRNHDSEPLHANVFDLGLLQSITPLSPGNLGWIVAPAHRLRVGGEHGFALTFPRRFVGDVGIETLKLFATSYPIDWARPLTPEAVRGPREPAELAALLGLAFTGRGFARLRAVRIPEGQAWISIQRTFELRRAAP